jgi:outer membrane protein assembly factor BamB
VNVRKTGIRSIALLSPLALMLGLLSGCGAEEKDPGDQVQGPHRVEKSDPSPLANPGSPRPGETGQHWIALSKAWQVAQSDNEPHHYGLAGDGKRVFALRRLITRTDPRPDGELTAYDAATGAQLWRKELPWLESTSPVADGDTIVVLAGDNRQGWTQDPGTYIAFDSTTGDIRWTIEVANRAASSTIPSDVRQPGSGAILDGVFYYADGQKVAGVDLVTGAERFKHVSENYENTVGPIVAGDALALIAKPTLGNLRVEPNHVAVVVNKDLSLLSMANFPGSAEPEGLEASGDILVSWGFREIWGIDKRTGKGVWTVDRPENADPTTPIGKVLPIHTGGDDEEELLGLDITTGKQLWKVSPKAAEESFRARKLSVADGTLFALGHGIEIIDSDTGNITFSRATVRGGGIAVATAEQIVIYNHDGITGYR